MRKVRRLVGAGLVGLLMGPAAAEVPLEGWFVAADSCPAFQSFNNQTNPGDINVAPGRAYEIIAANRADASHYLLRMPGVSPERRWVAVGCGIRTTAADQPAEVPAAPEPATTKPLPATLDTTHVLAISWQPAFCEGFTRKAECRSQGRGRYDTDHFALHGLWPQPRSNEYCDVRPEERAASEEGGTAWLDLPPVELPADLRQRLDLVMPGTQSGLDRHEWTRHGTCYTGGGGGAAAYYGHTLVLMDAINSSAVRDLFARNIGRKLTDQQIKEAFNAAFGREAGQRVRIACETDRDSGRELIVELTIGLGGDPAGGDLSWLIAAARPTRGDCREGIVDPVGFQ